MRQSLRLGKVAGIPVGVHWSVGVILALIADILAASVLPAAVPRQPPATYWLVAILAAVVFAASLLAHELAHAIIARRHGIRVRSITLWMLGGVAELDGDPPDPGADFRIAIAGPAASLAAAVVLYGLALGIGYAGGPAAAVTAATWLALMNGLLAVFNLLPGAPMDGGRVLRAILWRRYGDRQRAALAATRGGRYVGFGLMLLGLADVLFFANLLGGLWFVLIGWFLENAARAEAAATIATSALRGLTVADVMTPDPAIAPAWNTVLDFAERVAAHTRQSAFPVIGFDGQLAGIVTTEALARIRPADRYELRLRQVAIAVPPQYMAAPTDPAAPLLTRAPLGGEVLAVVLAHDQVVGLVTAADLSWAVQGASLRAQPESATRRSARPDSVPA